MFCGEYLIFSILHRFHFSEILQGRKVDLAQGFVYGDGDGIAQVQAPGIGSHGDADAFLIMLCQKFFRQALGLLAEEKIAVVLEVCFHIAPGCFRGETPHLLHIIFGEEVRKVFVVPDFDHMPVVKTGTADSLLADVKTQGADQVKPAAGGGAGSGDVAAVLGDLGFHQHDIQHFHHLDQNTLDTFCIRTHLIVCQILCKINLKNVLFSTFL